MCKCLSPIIWDYLLIIWTAIKQKLPARKSVCLGARKKISELGEGNDRYSPWQVTVFQPSLGIMKTAGHTSPCTVDKQVPWTYPCVPRSEVGKTWLLELPRAFAQKLVLFPLVLTATWVLKSEAKSSPQEVEANLIWTAVVPLPSLCLPPGWVGAGWGIV